MNENKTKYSWMENVIVLQTGLILLHMTYFLTTVCSGAILKVKLLIAILVVLYFILWVIFVGYFRIEKKE